MTTKASDFFAEIDNIATQPTERKNPTAMDGNSNNSQPKFFDESESEPSNTQSDKNIGTASTLSEAEIEAAGKTGAFLAGDCLETAFSLIERVVYINRFSGDEKLRMIDNDAKPQSEWTDSDISLDRKFLAVTAKHEKIKSKIPLTKRETEALEMAFAEKARITNKALDPQLIIWTSIAKIFINRSMDIFL